MFAAAVGNGAPVSVSARPTPLRVRSISVTAYGQPPS